MAGIVGLILLKNLNFDINILNKMLDAISNEKTQKRQSSQFKNIFFGSVLPVSDKNNSCIISVDKLNIDCIVEGNVFLNEIDKKQLVKKYELSSIQSENSLIPYLFYQFREKTPEHLTGWYNIFIVDKAKGETVLFNSRLGLLPLFYTQTDDCFIFSSKIDGILASGLVPLEFDNVTLTEYLLFHYPITDNTFLTKVKTLSNAEKISFNSSGINRQCYWSVKQLFGHEPLSKKKSVDLLMNAFHQSINKITSGKRKFAVSLTGGWDGRLVLADLLGKNIRNFDLYSFGAAHAPDIKIPTKIAQDLNLNYLPIVLDDNYMENNFLNAAKDTVMLSNGLRPYTRAHYLHTMKMLSDKVEFVLSGNCGSNILKFSQIVTGTVISRMLFHFINFGYNSDEFKKLYCKSDVALNVKLIPEEQDVFFKRMERIALKYSGFETLGQSYFSILLSIVERKYFGYELSSYNDYLYNYSPFIDIDFLNILSRTTFWGANYKFNSGSLVLKRKTSQLYASMIKHNFRDLIGFITDRGFTIKELLSPFHYPKIIFKKYLKKKQQHNVYYTDHSFEHFSKLLSKDTLEKSKYIKYLEHNDYFASYWYWRENIISKLN